MTTQPPFISASGFLHPYLPPNLLSPEQQRLLLATQIAELNAVSNEKKIRFNKTKIPPAWLDALKVIPVVTVDPNGTQKTVYPVQEMIENTGDTVVSSTQVWTDLWKIGVISDTPPTTDEITEWAKNIGVSAEMVNQVATARTYGGEKTYEDWLRHLQRVAKDEGGLMREISDEINTELTEIEQFANGANVIMDVLSSTRGASVQQLGQMQKKLKRTRAMMEQNFGVDKVKTFASQMQNLPGVESSGNFFVSYRPGPTPNLPRGTFITPETLRKISLRAARNGVNIFDPDSRIYVAAIPLRTGVYIPGGFSTKKLNEALVSKGTYIPRVSRFLAEHPSTIAPVHTTPFPFRSVVFEGDNQPSVVKY